MLKYGDRDAIVRAIDDNFVSYWKLHEGVVGVRLYDEDDCFRTQSPVPFPLFNSVMIARFNEDNLRTRLTEIIEPYEAAKLPIQWNIGPESSPSDLAEVLLDFGFEAKKPSIPGMAIDLYALPDRPAYADGFTAKRVETEEDANAYAEGCVAGFELPESSVIAFKQIAERNGENFSHFIGLVDGEPVSTSSLICADGVAGLYNVTTRVDARGRGAGGGITLAPLYEARRRGCSVGILHASEMGHPVYKRLGFETLCEIHQFVRPRPA